MSACTDTKRYQADVRQYDPLEQSGRDQRAQIFGALDEARPGQAVDTAATLDYLRGAASDPGFAAARQLANRTIAGDYLNGSTQLSKIVDQTRSGIMRGAADANAGIRDQYSRNGLRFGTGAQQAEQNSVAQANNQAGQAESQLRYTDYAGERQNQNNGTAMLTAATAAPANYLSNLAAARYAPQTAQAGIVHQLSGGNQVQATPQDLVQTPGMIQQATSAIGSL